MSFFAIMFVDPAAFATPVIIVAGTCGYRVYRVFRVLRVEHWNRQWERHSH